MLLHHGEVAGERFGVNEQFIEPPAVSFRGRAITLAARQPHELQVGPGAVPEAIALGGAARSVHDASPAASARSTHLSSA